MPLDEIDAFNDRPVTFLVDFEYLTHFTSIIPGNDQNRIAFLEFHLFLFDSFQITSGARDIIFMNFFSLSSLATGPKTRVPLGSI